MMTKEEALQILSLTLGTYELLNETNPEGRLFTDAFAMAIDALREQKHGKWNILDDCANEGVYCSECHKKVFKIDYSNTMKMRSNFCPNCGCQMDKGEE